MGSPQSSVLELDRVGAYIPLRSKVKYLAYKKQMDPEWWVACDPQLSPCAAKGAPPPSLLPQAPACVSRPQSGCRGGRVQRTVSRPSSAAPNRSKHNSSEGTSHTMRSWQKGCADTFRRSILRSERLDRDSSTGDPK